MGDLFAPRGTAALATTTAAPLAWTTPPNTASAWQSHIAAHATAAAATAAAATATAAIATAAATAAANAAADAAAEAPETPRPPSSGFWAQRATTPATPAVTEQAAAAEPARPSSARLALPSRTAEARASAPPPAPPRPATSGHTSRKPASPTAFAPRTAPTREVWVARRAAELAISRGAALLATDVLASPRAARPPSRSTPKPPGTGR